MRRSTSIQIKAAILLMVFTLNTLVGFACTVGFDMKLNESHHSNEKAVLAHKHTEPHHQEEKADSTHKHESSHSHDDSKTDHEHAGNAKDDCCTDEAVDFEQIDKCAPQFFDFKFQPVVSLLFFTGSYDFDAYGFDKFILNPKYFVRTHHTPIPEIRIAIQSLQI